MSRAYKILALSFLFLMLILIRFFEDTLFYDPYLSFFENDYLYIDSPRREVAKLVGFTTLRYVLNAVISLAIIYVVFLDKSMVKLSAVVYVLVFIILMSAYLYFVIRPRQEDYYMFFNMRRFLIQPIILILLLPAFYYHKLKS
ncbi:exosortase F system-associated protein [Tamlana sp. 2_MG-2023]|uniref:exosortase F system-associated membrane protein n=1 Tax=unclassified Tamlana TaxID=2614803 RepID=UPI0026E1CB37|nr:MULTISPECIES: exosortase F system-associated protein [unclassified Tamlana]MDO6760764.1 exosortase F system-associated protein [Tamlana sp. 2_MG-2023]MDO6791020.1 exosortase F system-associated protein [Tamlana sp. 1_MG-2023]